MKKLSLFFTATMVLIGLNLVSCKKDDESGIKDEIIIEVQDDAQVNDLLDEVDAEAEDISNSNSAQLTSLKSAIEDSTAFSGRTVEWVKTDTSKIGTITYTNFQHPRAKNERIKNGKIHVVITGSRSLNTYKRVVTFDNFTINGNKIEGTKVIEKISATSYRISMTNGKISFSDSTFITVNSDRKRTITGGINTSYYIWDDVYSFEGTSSGVNRKGKTFNKTTTKAIIIHANYKYPVEGTIKLVVDGNEMILDYGNGTYDNKATITYNGVSKEISLKK